MIKTPPMYSITYHKPEKFIRLTWLSGTNGMTDDDFRETLEVFSESALQHGAERMIIDVREFTHRPSAEVLAWRDDVTVAKYNNAGIRRQAWIWPGDVSSMKPSSDGRSYEERYFSSENDALSRNARRTWRERDSPRLHREALVDLFNSVRDGRRRACASDDAAGLRLDVLDRLPDPDFAFAGNVLRSLAGCGGRPPRATGHPDGLLTLSARGESPAAFDRR